MTAPVDFLGVWVLDPTRSEGPPTEVPVRGVYTILTQRGANASPRGLAFHVSWDDHEGASWVADSRTEIDGPPQAVNGDAALQLSTRWIQSDEALVSELRADGEIVQETRRTLVDDVLHVEQTLSGAVGPLRSVTVYTRGRVKQVLVYRRDLKMRKGKIAAQTAHASMAVLLRQNVGSEDGLQIPVRGPMAWWLQRGFAKIVLSVDDEDALLTVHREAEARGIPTALITDSGRTEFAGVPTKTAVALGPALAHEIDAITGRDGLVQTKLA